MQYCATRLSIQPILLGLHGHSRLKHIKLTQIGVKRIFWQCIYPYIASQNSIYCVYANKMQDLIQEKLCMSIGPIVYVSNKLIRVKYNY